jgi:TPR repeat protein
MNGIIEHDRTRQYAMYAEANSWLEKAVDQGNMEAAFWLGDMLRKGLGAKRDETRGVALIRQSAKAGNANAQAMLGALYWKGQAGVEKDLMKAHELMNKSILGENQQALALLARIENDMTEEQRKEAQASAKKLAREAKNAPKHTLPVKQ